ncbi:hypothetical protein DFP73DRAFT_635295, partial [Morchella snyderi]
GLFCRQLFLSFYRKHRRSREKRNSGFLFFTYIVNVFFSFFFSFTFSLDWGGLRLAS